MKKIIEEINETKNILTTIRKNVSAILPNNSCGNRIESIKSKIRFLKQEKLTKLNEIQIKKEQLAALNVFGRNHSFHLQSNVENLYKNCEQLLQLKSNFGFNHSNYLLVSHTLIKKQSELAEQLLLIYPIETVIILLISIC